eukprot:m.149674 g.149674  ORF g.149674 m.149674 type:complete len:1006 (+) comp38529_c1_seq34:312-3329(+)
MFGQRIFDCKIDHAFTWCRFDGKQRLVLWTQTSKSGIEIPLKNAETRQAVFTHCMMILMKTVFEFKNKKEMKVLLNQAEEEEKPAILIFVDKYGSQIHKAFMSVSMAVAKTAILGYTNNNSLTLPDRQSLTGKEAHMVAVQPDVDTEKQAVFSYPWKFNEFELNKYFQIQTLPLMFHLNGIGVETPYDHYGLHIAYVLIMPEQLTDKLIMIGALARKYRDAFGFVIVNMRIFEEHYQNFGLNNPKKYPILSVKIHGEIDRYELIDVPNSFTEEVLGQFLSAIESLYKDTRNEQYITVANRSSYRNVVYETPKDTLVVFCHGYLEVCDGKFQGRIRRLGRGIQAGGYADRLMIVYVPLERFDEKSFDEVIDETNIPDVRFRRAHSREFTGFEDKKGKGKIKLKMLLRFLAQLGYRDIPVMKKTAGDEIPLANFRNEDFEALGDDREELTAKLGVSKENFQKILKAALSERDGGEESAEKRHVLGQLEKESKEESVMNEKKEETLKQTQTKQEENEQEKDPKILSDDHEEPLEGGVEENKEDDELAAGVFVMRKKKLTKWIIKADRLSDETFNKTRSECDVMPVLFWSPWSAKSKALSLIYNEVSDVVDEGKVLFKPNANICLRHVDCTAYPSVCDWFSVYSYPTVKLFKRNSYVHYKGMYQAEEMAKAIQLFQYEPVLELLTHPDLANFGENIVNDVLLLPEVTVLGLFKEKTRREYKVFKQLAEDEHTKAMFGATFGDLAEEYSKEMQIELPAVVVRRNMPNLLSSPETTYTFDGSVSLKDFYLRSRVPVGELTPLKFPNYKAAGLPLVIAFLSPEHIINSPSELDKDPDSEIHPQERVFLRTIYRMGKEKKFTDKLILTWMDAEKYGFVLASYMIESHVPALAIVDFGSGNMYGLQKPGVLRSSHLRSWVEDYLNGNLEPTGHLKEKEWKPVHEPIDFISRQEAEEKRKSEGGKDSSRSRIGRISAKPPKYTGIAPEEDKFPPRVNPEEAMKERRRSHHGHEEL